jgi:hypothetical protein
VTDPEAVHELDGAAHVDQCVDATQLVELHVVDGDAVDSRLGGREPREHAHGGLADAPHEFALLEDLPDGGPRPRRDAWRGDDIHVQRRDAVTLDPLDDDLDRVDPESLGNLVEPGSLGSCIQQSPEQHVAGEASDTVEIQRARHGSPAPARAIVAAMVPAPNPSSIPTTANPAAQELSMALSAVRP